MWKNGIIESVRSGDVKMKMEIKRFEMPPVLITDNINTISYKDLGDVIVSFFLFLKEANLLP